MSSVKDSLGTAAPSPQQGTGGEGRRQLYTGFVKGSVLMYKSYNQSDRRLWW